MSNVNVLPMYVVYYDTIDFPGIYVVRKWSIGAGGTVVADSALFAQAKAFEPIQNILGIDMGLICIAPSPSDDPKIVCTFM